MSRHKGGTPVRAAWFVVAGLVAFMVVLAGCGGGSSSSGGSSGGGGGEELQKLGKGEGQVNLISWAGYVEAGGGENPDWVTPFEEETGCKVNDKVAGTSDEMVKLMETGQYDGVSASGNATARLWAAHEVAPVNTALVPNSAELAAVEYPSRHRHLELCRSIASFNVRWRTDQEIQKGNNDVVYSST